MDARTLEALKASIKHWEETTAATDVKSVKIGASECALCGLFNTPDMVAYEECVGCPVYRATERSYCEGTPFDTAYYLLEHGGDFDLFRAAAKAELDFLRSLLPEGETP
jgi:hypothetical protein